MKLYHALPSLPIVDQYFDIINPKRPELAKINILISYNYLDDKVPATFKRLKEQGKIDSTFLDAGTYGENPGGNNPGLVDNYEAYLWSILTFGQHFDYISSYDNRFLDPAHNRTNYEEILDELKRHDAEHGTQLAAKLVPVIHTREPRGSKNKRLTPANEFLGYIEDGANTIGIGSSPTPSDTSMRQIKMLRDKHNVRAHRFGNFGFKFIVKWEIESADSGRYFRSAQFGKEVWFWDSHKNEPVCWDLRSPKPMPEEYANTLDQVFGWSVNDLVGSGVEKIWMVNIFSHQQMQHYLTVNLGI